WPASVKSSQRSCSKRKSAEDPNQDGSRPGSGNCAASFTPVEHLPQEIVMPVEDMVDAALAGFDQGEFVTVPALPDAAQWQSYEAARQALMPNLSRAEPAARYGVVHTRF